MLIKDQIAGFPASAQNLAWLEFKSLVDTLLEFDLAMHLDEMEKIHILSLLKLIL